MDFKALYQYIKEWHSILFHSFWDVFRTKQSLQLEIIALRSQLALFNHDVVSGKSPTEKQIQSWKTFLKNHAPKTWAMDYFTVPTLTFKILYVLIIINHGTRKIEHFAVTSNPNLFWLKQQIRNATPYEHKPKYLIHDNDSVFVLTRGLTDIHRFRRLNTYQLLQLRQNWNQPQFLMGCIILILK